MEVGNHDSLITKNGLYAELVKKQQNIDEEQEDEHFDDDAK